MTIRFNFAGGTHGHFIAHICNTLVHPRYGNRSPFNDLGQSHNFKQDTLAMFRASHLFRRPHIPPPPNTVNIIWDKEVDVLPLILINYHRSRLDQVCDPALIYEDIYNKLHNTAHSDLIDDLERSYNIDLKELGSCPVHIFREFFKYGFNKPLALGFNLTLDKLIDFAPDAYRFNFTDVYDLSKFTAALQDMFDYFNIPFKNSERIVTLHKEFMSKQPYYNATNECNGIVDHVKNGDDVPIPSHFSILYESYINSCLEKYYRIEMPFNQDTYFKTTGEIITYIFNSPMLTENKRERIIIK